MHQVAREKIGVCRLTALLALLCATSPAWGCGRSDPSPTATATSTNPLADFKACGGDPRGDWRVASYQTDMDDASRIVSEAFGDEPACQGALTGVHSRAEGTFTFKPDGTYEYLLGVSSDFDLALTDACFSALAGGADPSADPSADLHLTDVECTALEAGFEKSPTLSGAACGFTDGVCACSISIEETQTPGQGSYTVRDRELLLSREAWNFCAHDGRLELMRNGPDGRELLVMVRR